MHKLYGRQVRASLALKGTNRRLAQAMRKNSIYLQLQLELKRLREYRNYFVTPDTNAHTHFAIGKTQGG